MKSGVRALCRALIVPMMFLSFHTAHAGMIGTHQAVAAGAPAGMGPLNTVLARAEIVKQLEAFGVSPATAKDRVGALSDQEVRTLARQLETLPAGGNHGFWILFGIVVVGLALWWIEALPRPPR
jgi:hypothetical protein